AFGVPCSSTRRSKSSYGVAIGTPFTLAAIARAAKPDAAGRRRLTCGDRKRGEAGRSGSTPTNLRPKPGSRTDGMPNITDTITTPDGTCTVRLFPPEGDGPWPGVVMYPDAGGVRETFDEMGAKLADFGYAVLVPDIYYRLGDWEPIDMKTAFGDPEERKRLMSMIGSVTPETMTADARAFFDYLAGRPEGSGDRFGTTGYCVGGRTSVVVAGRVPDRVAAAMSFHGGGLVTDTEDSPHLKADQIQAAVDVGGAEDDAGV